MKKCNQCNIIKDLDNFYTKKNKKPTSYCKDCCKNRSKEQVYNFKYLCLEHLKTHSCMNCGYDRNQAALDFHHLDPNEKDFLIKGNHIKLDDKTKQELDKCIVLCANCHREIHNGTLEYIDGSFKESNQPVFSWKKKEKTIVVKPTKLDRVYHTKINLSREELENYLIKYKGNLSAISTQINLSDNGFKKKCLKVGLNPKDYKTI